MSSYDRVRELPSWTITCEGGIRTNPKTGDDEWRLVGETLTRVVAILVQPMGATFPAKPP